VGYDGLRITFGHHTVTAKVLDELPARTNLFLHGPGFLRGKPGISVIRSQNKNNPTTKKHIPKDSLLQYETALNTDKFVVISAPLLRGVVM
jgi:hypothetical protein